MSHTVPLIDLRRQYRYMKADIDAALQRCLEHQHWILGPEVGELEEKIAAYLDIWHCVGTSSGTDALVLALRALAIRIKGNEYWDRSDLIITTPFTFTATGDAILRSGATPFFVDIDPASYTIDPGEIRNAVGSVPDPSNVAGILPVHLYGRACRMDGIMEVADEFGLFVLEDAAQAFGGMWQREKLGTIGTAGAFSFFPSKNLGGFGDGGMVATDDADIAELVRQLLKHGGRDKYNVEHIGYNARLDTLQAAVLLAKLKYIDEFAERRKNIAVIYGEELNSLEGLVLPSFPSLSPDLPAVDHVYHQYTVRVRDGKRGELQRHLTKQGISTMVYYPVPLHTMKVFNGRSFCGSSSFPLPSPCVHAEKAAAEVLSLPVDPLMDEAEIRAVVSGVKSFFK